ncbi:hypothetical protein [Sphingomonas solaris]|uniref:Phage holin family protein n=1 Tax=Alterirhizorhabdus solaris TaxID=2529389 RepID=A0A558QWN2_9SPHN|nr:hypothetical protein [Sphingomonas solaris]TVV71563.1 hypothetical protein FOY91_16520 [Sphingomonas solaris]
MADGKTYVSAEIDVYRQKALSWVPPVRTAAILGIAALFIAQAAITTLLVFLGFWLALWLGPLGGGVAAAAIGLIVAGLLAYLAVRQFSAGGR